MIPLGGKFAVPLFKERLQILGGGISYLGYYESAKGHGNETVVCRSCQSRGGWGPYQTAQILYFPSKSRTFGVGVQGR